MNDCTMMISRLPNVAFICNAVSWAKRPPHVGSWLVRVRRLLLVLALRFPSHAGLAAHCTDDLSCPVSCKYYSFGLKIACCEPPHGHPHDLSSTSSSSPWKLLSFQQRFEHHLLWEAFSRLFASQFLHLPRLVELFYFAGFSHLLSGEPFPYYPLYLLCTQPLTLPSFSALPRWGLEAGMAPSHPPW